ncbi:MAG: HAD family hydrolase [Candidatus Woesearchaeota archaeon]
MIKALLFDLDNTLYDYEICHNFAMKAVYNEFKKIYKCNYEEFEKIYDEAKQKIHLELSGSASEHNRIIYFQRIFENLNKVVSVDEILTLYDVYYKAFFKRMKPYPYVTNALKLLKNNYKLAIVTNLLSEIQLRKLKVLKLSKYFDVFVSSEEAGREKPHPDIYLLALHKLEVLAKEAVMIGDSTNDIEGAKHLQIVALKFVPENKKLNEDIKNEMVFHSFKELPKIIESLNKSTY